MFTEVEIKEFIRIKNEDSAEEYRILAVDQTGEDIYLKLAGIKEINIDKFEEMVNKELLNTEIQFAHTDKENCPNECIETWTGLALVNGTNINEELIKQKIAKPDEKVNVGEFFDDYL